MGVRGLCLLLVAAALLQLTTCQTTTAPATTSTQARPALGEVTAPPGGDLSYDNFNYSSNTYGLAGPQVEKDGLDKGQVAGIVIGCVLFGLLVGALSMMCWLKRKRLFPDKYGPCEHPGEAPPVGPIDVLRSGSKLDSMTKTELSNVKSFSNRSPVDVRAFDGRDNDHRAHATTTTTAAGRVDPHYAAAADRV